VSGSSAQQPSDGTTGNVCPSGSYCPPGAVKPIACPVGTYNDQVAQQNSSACLPCQKGYYCPFRGGSTSTYQFNVLTTYVCGAGFICNAGAMDPNPTPSQAGSLCPAGSQCQADGLGPHSCAASYYQPNEGSTSCLNCPAGL
jgi:hypothetical protein